MPFWGYCDLRRTLAHKLAIPAQVVGQGVRAQSDSRHCAVPSRDGGKGLTGLFLGRRRGVETKVALPAP